MQRWSVYRLWKKKGVSRVREYYPLLIVGAVIGLFTLVFITAFALIKDKKKAISFDRNMKDGEIVRRLLKYAKPYRWNFVLVLVIVLFSITYDVVSPLLIGRIEEIVKNNFEMDELLRMVGLYFGVLMITIVCTYAQAMILQITGQKILSAIREDVFNHIEGLSHEQLNHIPVGKLVTRVTNDTNHISMMFTNLIVNLVKNLFVIVGVLVAMLALNYELTLMVLCFVPFIAIFAFIFRKFSRKAYRRVKDAVTDINTFLSENLSGIKITQIFNCEEKKLKEFRQRNQELKTARDHEIYVFAAFRPSMYMLYMASVLGLLYLGGKGYIKNTAFFGQVITSGTIVSFYMYINKFYNPIQNLAEQFNRLQSAFASSEKIFTIMDMESEIKEDPNAYEPDHIRGEIEFKNVWFAYEGEEWVLKDVSFHVNPKETVAFVGSTGSGKTTILALVCRNYDIQKGQILIDGIDIRKIKISALRSHFGQMLQDVFLFAGTVRSNILLRMEGVDDKEVMEACRYVNADKFIDKLTKGLDEEVRERGNNFSQGQRQLLSFARTIIHKPDVMILDEATANIDTETELLIQNSLEKMMNIGTMLIVAHRLSTIQHADKIIVISHGKIIEQGNHFELLEKKGAYYELYKLQYE
ncbi:MAG: ABC transporter ATP-binding protein/permease [Lachnospiraceae bacterium]|nr:ABC transporter ATP-binding protein/permease [Lachnospiraceae bacterium]